MHDEWPLCSGGAGLTSSAGDYAKFLQMYLGRGAGEGGRILKEATVDSVMADQAPGLLSGPWQQGLAFGVKRDTLGAGRFFWSGYFNTQYYADPSTQEVVVLDEANLWLGERHHEHSVQRTLMELIPQIL